MYLIWFQYVSLTSLRQSDLRMVSSTDLIPSHFTKRQYYKETWHILSTFKIQNKNCQHLFKDSYSPFSPIQLVHDTSSWVLDV